MEADDMYIVSYFLSQHLEIVKLDFCYNNIGDEGIKILVDEFLSRENNIRHLNLISCSIGWVGMKHLSSIASTLKLTTLRMNGNKLGGPVGMFVWKA